MIGRPHSFPFGSQNVVYWEQNFGQSSQIVIFLHGWGGTAASWEDLWRTLEKNSDFLGRCIAFDLPGFGDSPPPLTAWSLEDYVKLIESFCDHAGVSKVDLVAHSFGGRITTVFAATHPDRVRRIVYIAPAGIRHRSVGRSIKMMIARILKMTIFRLPFFRSLFPLFRVFGYRIIGAGDFLKAHGVMKEIFQNVMQRNLTPFFRNITAPTLIFWGKKDSYVPVKDGAIMAAEIPHARLHIFADGRHGIHRTHAANMSVIMIPFLTSP